MKHLKFLVVITILISTAVSAQRSVNSYKYLIVPVRYEFQRSDDQFQVNSLVKFLFKKEGFTVFLSNEEFPDELKLNRCLALTALLNDNSKLFNTKMNFDLIDCDNNVLFSSEESTSKEKDYKTAYFACARETFEGVKELNYKYEPIDDNATQEVAASSADNISNNSEPESVVASANKRSANTVVPVTTAVVVVEKGEPETVEVLEKTEQVKATSEVLYAQPIANGYQIVDATPKVIYKLLNTGLENVYLLDGHSAIVYKDGEEWKVEYYENGKPVVKTLNLKFF
ncbi:hypothetical protein [Urechidicola vernalis]|uniref:Secreted protein n=1 Tax=Urechidicola vernalis TaxID=3075600 RepID=A0ABU2Y313_9FLAO|nr:hypothetical protein [Urechidicola sp. P050]MDT0552591.1 hypothetical protein [Urechidicola sp. P050]